MDLLNAAFFIALLKIIWVNILLSGDNAVVIALAARNLAAEQQKKAIIFGSGAAIVLRVVLTAKKITPRETDDYGEVTWDAVLLNQDDELVATYDVLTLVAKDESQALG